MLSLWGSWVLRNPEAHIANLALAHATVSYVCGLIAEPNLNLERL